jgi:hypothetical protein
MRYEMILFPAAAVAAGAGVAWLLGMRGSPFAVAVPGRDERAGRAERVGRGARGDRSERDHRDVGDHRGVPADEVSHSLWIPQFVGCSVVLIACLVVSALGGSQSTTVAPASPAPAAMQAGRTYTPQPLASPGAEVTLKSALNAATDVAGGAPQSALDVPFDWVHDLRYRPTGPGDPNWIHRSGDGTTITRRNAMSPEESVAFSNAITFGRTVKPDSLEILSRVTSRYGEDVEFEVTDTLGRVHRGTATTLYPIWDPKDPGLVTSLVYEP